MRTLEISMVAYWKQLVMKFSGGDIHQGEHGIHKDFHTLYSFSFIRFLSHWVFPDKVLTRQCRSKIDSQKQCQLWYSDRWSTVWLQDILSSIRGSVPSIKTFPHCTLFPSSRFLSHWVFPGKVLTRQCRTHVNIHRILCYAWLCTLFPFDQFLSHWVLLARFLTRHIPYHLWSPRGSVVN